jgi:predicted RNase H-like nuclease (RuvC/YqgF family)
VAYVIYQKDAEGQKILVGVCKNSDLESVMTQLEDYPQDEVNDIKKEIQILTDKIKSLERDRDRFESVLNSFISHENFHIIRDMEYIAHIELCRQIYEAEKNLNNAQKRLEEVGQKYFAKKVDLLT